MLLVVCAAAFGLGSGARGQSRDRIFQNVDYHTSAEPWGPSTPTAINDDGTVVGDCYDLNTAPGPDRHLGADGFPMASVAAYVWSRGRVTRLRGPLGNGDLNLVAINSKGQMLLAQFRGNNNGANFDRQVLMRVNNAGRDMRYFLYDPDRKDMTPIGLAGQTDSAGTMQNIRLRYLTGLTDAGQVLGVYFGPPHGHCAVIGTPTFGTVGDAGPPPTAPAAYTLIGGVGGGNVAIRAINIRGRAAGNVDSTKGFLWSDGKLTTFTVPGSPFTVVNAINDAGVVVGYFQPGRNLVHHGFVYDGSQFRLVDVPRSMSTFVTNLNNRGQIVGYYETNSYECHGFVANIADLPVMPSP